MLTYVSHTTPFGCEAFSFACVFPGDVKDAHSGVPTAEFQQFHQELNKNGFSKKKENWEGTIK